MAKGTLYLMIASALFIGSGYVIHLGLARMVSPEEYGRFGVILAMLQVIQIFLIKGIPNAVTKYVAEGRDSLQTKRIAVKLQGLFSFIIFLGLFSLAPFIADKLNDDKMSLYIMMISIIIPIRAIFTVYTGYLTGLREFRRVSFISNINNVSRVLLVFSLLFIGFGISGAIGGYIGASIIALILSYYFSKSNIAGENISLKEIISFGTPMILFSVCYLAIMNLDIIFVKGLVENPDDVGYYTAARMLATLVLGVIMGLSLTLFPTISYSVSKNNLSQTQNYITGSIRYVVMILSPLCIIISIYAEGFLTFFYPEVYSAGSTSLSILVFGSSFIALFIIFGTIINGAGYPRISSIIGGVLVIISIILNYFLVNKYGMVGGAWSIFIVGGIGMTLSGMIIYRMFKAIMEWRSFLRISVAVVMVGIFSLLVDVPGILLIVWSLILLIIYFGVLFLLKEIKRKDIELVKALVGWGR